MIQCSDCEFYSRRPDGSAQLSCDPFSTIKEPECVAKWQLAQLNVIAASHQATLEMHRKFAPMQEKMLRHMEREIDEADEVDGWKFQDEDDEDRF